MPVLPAESAVLCCRSSMLVEVVVTLCLYYLRSYYPSLSGLSRAEVLGNRQAVIRIKSCSMWAYGESKTKREMSKATLGSQYNWITHLGYK